MKGFYRMVVLLLGLSLSVAGKEPVDLQMITRIKQEGLKNSQVMETLRYLTDVHGPRLTNSTGYRKAAEWARDRLSEWGLARARLEAWGTFGRGWETDRFSAEMISPRYLRILAYPLAWTPGTDGVVRGQPVLIPYDEETPEEKYQGKLKGGIVLLGEPDNSELDLEPAGERLSEADLHEKWLAPEPAQKRDMERIRHWRQLRAQRKKLSNFLAAESVGAVLSASRSDYGILRVHSGGSYKMNPEEPTLPGLVIAKEHYNLIARLLEKEIPVELEINVQNRFLTDDSLGYNVLAEIPGSDRKLQDEVVMLGAHLDSWHAGTGATDDASGCAVMMEAVRILKAIDAKPRRTIRVALWSGEEQGLLGSRGYVKSHFGDRKSMELTPAHQKFSAYYNLDNGTGKIRGIYLQENDAARPFFEAMFEPFRDMGAETVVYRRTGSTDHAAFDEIGLPGFQFIQDPLDYFSRTWHTNMDVYDHLQEGDLMQMSVIVASIVYHTAMREEKIPRKPLPKARKEPHRDDD